MERPLFFVWAPMHLKNNAPAWVESNYRLRLVVVYFTRDFLTAMDVTQNVEALLTILLTLNADDRSHLIEYTSTLSGATPICVVRRSFFLSILE